MSAVDIGCSESEAENFLNMYFARFPRFRAWMKSQIRFCRDHGYVRTLTGRYRRIPEIRSTEFWKSSHAERQALNSPVQGTAMDILKKVMLNIDASGLCEAHGAYMTLQVHAQLRGSASGALSNADADEATS